MSIDWTTRPISTWPGKRTGLAFRKHGPFKTDFNATRRGIDRELAHLGARRAVLEMECEERDIRLDGFLRADAKVKGPGVIVSFSTAADIPLRFACDTYHTWLANLRAIGLTLEALRAVDRYGATQKSEQYRGFAALPADAAVMDAGQAVAWLSLKSGFSGESMRGNLEVLREAWRKACMVTHPDQGGTDADFKRTQEARRVLGL